MTSKLPARAGKIANDYPEIWHAYQALGSACHEAGPLDARTRRLIKLALAIGKGTEGAVHSHVRQGLDEGLTAEELKQVALLGFTTLGFPGTVAALSWMDDILEK